MGALRDEPEGAVPLYPKGRLEPDLSESRDILRGARVLVVEDNYINQQVAMEILSGAGIVVQTADNGLDAIKELRKSSYQAVLMDVQMPIMDGFKTTRIIRRDHNLKDIPIIAMTANAMQGDRELCLKEGMDDYVAKPIERNRLLAAIEKWIRRKNPLTETTGEQPSAILDEGPADVQDWEELEAAVDIDTGEILQRLGGNKELFVKLMLNFREAFENIVPEIQSALKRQDIDEAIAVPTRSKEQPATFLSKVCMEPHWSWSRKLNEGHLTEWSCFCPEWKEL
jgi:two-component system sensor histidine kinase/response regulator